MDPRRPGYDPDHASKRKPSKSPPSGTPAKIPKTANGNNKAAISTVGGPDPAANMTSPATMAADSLVDMLMSFGNQCSTVATTQVFQQRAQESLVRANAEFERGLPHFKAFPHIKEQKTAAKTKAERNLEAVSTKLVQQKNAQKRLATDIAALVQQGQPASSNEATRNAEVKRLEQKCSSLENKLGDQGFVPTSDLQRIEKKCNELDQKLGDLTRMMEKFKSVTGQVQDFQRKAAQCEQDMKAIDGRLSSLQNHVAGDSLQDKILTLMVQIEKTKNGPKTTSTADTLTRDEIEARFQEEKDLASKDNNTRDNAIASYVENEINLVKDGIRVVKDKVVAVSHQITTVSNARDQDVARVNTLKDDISTDMSAVRSKLTAVEDKVKACETNGLAVIEQAKEIASLREQVSTKVDKNFVTGAMHKFAKGQNTAQPPSRTPSPGTALNGASTAASAQQVNGFHPQVNQNGHFQMVSPTSPHLSDINHKIQRLFDQTDMLSYVTQRLQCQYDNLTTDDVCQAMVEQMGEVWPYAKDWNNCAMKLEARQADLDTKQHELEGTVARTRDDAGMALRAASGAINTAKEIKEAVTPSTEEALSRSEVLANACEELRRGLQGVVKQVKELESKGGAQLGELDGKVKVLMTEVSKVKGRIEAYEQDVLK